MTYARPKLRIIACAFLLGISLDATGCAKLGLGDNNPTSPSGPPAAGSTINYSAVGASDAWGVGSSVICAADCPDGTGYVFVTERALRSQGFTVNLTLLGIPTATIGADFQSLGNQYGHTVLCNLIDCLAPFVTRDATVVTIFAGGNDVEVVLGALGGGAGASNQSAYIDSQVQAFKSDYNTLIAAVRARSAGARIVAINLPNFAGIPMHSGDPLLNRQGFQRASVGMTTVINALTSQNVLVVDLMCNPAFYQGSTYSSDGFHPSDAGYALLSNLVVQAINSSAFPNPAASCSQMNIV
jgi:lysophospholipase L1-like esterase